MNKQLGKFSTIGPILGLSLAALGAAALPAAASDPTVTFNLADPYQVVNLNFDTSTNPLTSESFDGVVAGGYEVSGLPSANFTSPTYVFCTDLFDEVDINEQWQVAVNPASHLSPTDPNYPVQLTQPEINEINNIAATYLNNTTTFAGDSFTYQEAAQIAVWDIADGGTVTDTNGYAWSSQFNASVDANELAEIYNIEQTGTPSSAPSLYWLDPVTGTPGNGTRPQDFLTLATPSLLPNTPTAPEPSAMSVFALVGLGLAGLAARKRLRSSLPAATP